MFLVETISDSSLLYFETPIVHFSALYSGDSKSKKQRVFYISVFLSGKYSLVAQYRGGGSTGRGPRGPGTVFRLNSNSLLLLQFKHSFHLGKFTIFRSFRLHSRLNGRGLKSKDYF